MSLLSLSKNWGQVHEKRLSSQLVFFQNRPWYFWAAIIIATVFVIRALLFATAGQLNIAAFWANFAVLAVAAATLLATLPTPAKLWVERQDELNIDDIVFFLSDDDSVPRDILIQTHVAVANTGGRKVVLSGLQIDALLDKDGNELHIPGLELPVPARQVTHGSGWRITDNVQHHHVFQNFIAGPYILEPDDVITMQLRFRRGIDWSQRWTLERIRELASALQEPIVAVRVTAVYRRGSQVERLPFVIRDLVVLQQAPYVSRLQELTDDFRLRPTIPEQAITD